MSHLTPVPRYRLILEGHGCKEKITQAYMKAFLLDLTKRIDMQLLPLKVGQDNPGGAYVHESSGKEPGPSAWVFWTESGGQMHCWEKYGFVTLDMFSCKDFSILEVDTLFRYYFKPKSLFNCIPVVGGARG